METLLEPILAELDMKVVIVAVGILLTIGIIALVKKVMKAGISVIIVAILIATLGPMAQSFQENYRFNIEGGVMQIGLGENDYVIDRDSCKEIKLTNKGIAGYEVEAVFEDGLLKIMIPTFMMGQIVTFSDRYNIPTTVIE